MFILIHHLDHPQSIHDRHPNIRHDNIGRPLPVQLHGFFSMACSPYVVSSGILPLDHNSEPLPDILLIIYDQ
ncbi:hypothetical protein D3C85_1521930 [compost metagenome]